MKTTILSYRKRIKLIEVEAANKVDIVFRNPFLLQDEKQRKILNEILLKEISPLETEAEKEGNKFGTFIRGLTLEVRKKKGTPTPTTQAPPATGINIDKNKERELFIEELIHIQDNMIFEINQQTKRMENQGMSKEEIFKYLRGNWMLLEWKAVKNKLRKEIADYINAVSNCGYYKGLGGAG